MWKDPIVEETRALRAGLAQAHGNDLFALGRYLMAQQATSTKSALPATRLVTRTSAPRRALAGA